LISGKTSTRTYLHFYDSPLIIDVLSSILCADIIDIPYRAS